MYRNLALAGAILAVGLFASVSSADDLADDLGRRASWHPPTPQEVRQQLDDWLKTQKVDEIAKIKIDALWPKEGSVTDPAELLDQLTATFAIFNADVKQVVDHCRSPHVTGQAPDFKVLNDKDVAPIVRNNLKLLYARWLAQHDLYNEALDLLEGPGASTVVFTKPDEDEDAEEPAAAGPKDPDLVVTADEVVDPAALLFYKSVGYHRLLKKAECLPVLAKLLENEDNLPMRYTSLAKLMEADIKPLKSDSLDEIARIMRNIENRLGKARAGTRVREEEQAVVDKLDKLIEQMEKSGGGGGGGGGAGGSNNPSAPMNDSNAAQGKGAGDINRKKGSGEGWGNLPPKDREAALTELSKDLPAHYRAVIEEYFRKLARER